MTEQRPALGSRPPVTARIIHTAITAAVVIIFAVFLFLQTRMDPIATGTAAPILKWAGLCALAVAALVSYRIRAGIPVRTGGANLDDWWIAHFGKAVISWAAAEGGGLMAIILGWLAANSTVMAAGAAVALALLFISRPGALEGAV